MRMHSTSMAQNASQVGWKAFIVVLVRRKILRTIFVPTQWRLKVRLWNIVCSLIWTQGVTIKLFHTKMWVWVHSAKVFGVFFSEETKVGKHLVKGMRDIADRVATHKNKGMLSKTCRSLLSTLLMTVACFQKLGQSPDTRFIQYWSTTSYYQEG